jgi:hypothetical protein
MIELLAIVTAAHVATAAPASDRCETLASEMGRACSTGHWPTGIQIFGPACDRATRRFDICEKRKAKP